MVSGQIQKYSMAVTVYWRFLSTSLSENDNENVGLCGYWDFDFCICYHCDCNILSYPYKIALSVTEMEKALGVLQVQKYGTA